MYGIWNNIKKEFQFGIAEPTRKKAESKLFQLIGYDSYKWRFETRKIPKNLKKKGENKVEILYSGIEILQKIKDMTLKKNSKLIDKYNNTYIFSDDGADELTLFIIDKGYREIPDYSLFVDNQFKIIEEKD